MDTSSKGELKQFSSFLEKFFNKKIDSITINVFEERWEFDQKLNKETPDWMVGCAIEDNIFVLSPQAMENESTHKREEFTQILKHEMCHVFIQSISPFCLKSMEEGLCLNLAGQDRTAKIRKEYFKMFFGKSIYYNLINPKRFADLQGYQLSYMMVGNMLRNFNQSQIIQLLKIPRTDKFWNEKIEYITQMKFEDYNKFLKTGIGVI